MKRILGPLLAVLTMAVAGVAPARAQDIKNYSWSGASTPEALPPTYQDSSGTSVPTYAISNGRLRAASTGALGTWVGKQFDWPMANALANNEKVTGSLKFRINGLENNGNAAGNRIRLFQFNAPWANGLPALFTLMGSDSTVDLGPGNWRPGGHGDWNKWEMNPNTTGSKAPAGKTYLYNSFNMSNPAKDPDYCRLVDNGVDHVLTWTAQYDESCDAVKVATALDGVAWTVTYVARHWPDWLLGGGWTENALAKAWPNMGAWDMEFSEIKWATTTATAPSDVKNYEWSGLSGCQPPVYKDSSGTPIPTYDANWKAGSLRAASTGALGTWVGKQFDWPMASALANNEKVTGSLKFRINGLENNGNAAGNRIRLFQFNAPWANGLPALLTLMGSDSTVDLGPGNWRPGGHGDWNKWEMNPNTTGSKAPAGKTYLYNSFNMSNPAKDPDYCRLVDNGVDHVLTWSAQYDESCDAIKVATALDGVAWTVTYVARHWPDWLLGGGWTENALAKAWPNMGAWDAEFSEIKWVTTTTTAPSDVKNYEWNGLSGCQPPVYKDSSGTPIPTYDANWKAGSLRAASTGALGTWVGKQFDWPMTSALANDEYITGRIVFRIDGLENNGNAAGNRIRLFQFNAPWANGLPALFTLMGSDSTVDLGPGNWRPGGHGDWNKWEMNPNTTGSKAPAGKTYVYNSFNMSNPATDADYCRLLDNGVDHVLTWTARYTECDVVRVTTVLDGVPWTSTDIGRQYPDWLLGGGWTENALAKAWPNMGAWDVRYSALSWKTQSGAPLACPPTLGISTLPSGELELRWSAGSLYEASDFNGTWTKVEASSPYKTTSAGARKFYRAATP